MATPSVSDYTDLITAWHRGKPKFTATVAASVDPIVETIKAIAALPSDFDLDTAVGAQLDVVGEWVGISRFITMPLTTPWFSFGIPNRGFGIGIWRGPYSPTTGISPLDDGTYRDLIRCKILANNWDGTMATAAAVYGPLFSPRGHSVFAQDDQDMSMVFGISGQIPNTVLLSILAGKYIPVKPVGVETRIRITSVDNRPIFGFGVQNSRIAGFGAGAFGVPPERLLARVI